MAQKKATKATAKKAATKKTAAAKRDRKSVV